MNPLLHWLNAPEWTQLVAALLHSLWQGALLAILLAVLLRRLTQPHLRYYASLGTLGILVLASIITWAAFTAPKTNAPAAPAPLATEPAVAPIFAPALNLDSPDKVIAIGTPISPAPPTVPWTAWLALFWMLGTIAMLLRAGIKVAGAEKLRRSCQPLTDETMTLLVVEACRAINLARKIRVAVTDQLTSPAVVGILVPTLILPLSLFTTLTPEQIRFILLHELAHIRRGDYLANLFQLLAEALLFFNPAVWWLSHHIRREREACCDALAIELSGAPADYAKTLVRVAENTLPTAPTTALAFGEDDREPSSLADRVQRLLVPGYRPALRLTWRAMLTSLFVAGALLFLSAVGSRITVAAILSPQQRLEQIEQKMADYGQQPRVGDSGDLDDRERIPVTARLRTANGSPLPNGLRAILHSRRERNSGVTAVDTGKDGALSATVWPGQIWIEAQADGYAPTIIGPIDARFTNRVDVGDVVLERGFPITVEVVDSESGAPIPAAELRAQFWIRSAGNSMQNPRLFQMDSNGRATLSNCVDQPLTFTLNTPGFELSEHRFETLQPDQSLRIPARRGAIAGGIVLDKNSGAPLAGARIRLYEQIGPEGQRGYGWESDQGELATTDNAGRFVIQQLRANTRYWLGVTAPGRESVLLAEVRPGQTNLLARLGPELVVNARVLGNLTELKQERSDYTIGVNLQDSDIESFISTRGLGIKVTERDGVGYFQFTNRVAGPVTVSTGKRDFKRVVDTPVADWVIDLREPPPLNVPLPTREVVFRFIHASGVPPRGTVEVTIPSSTDRNQPSSRNQEMEIQNGEVRAEMAIGGRTSIAPKKTVGYWFQDLHSSVTVTNGDGPMIIEIPSIPAGAVYVRARHADGSPAHEVYFTAVELKPSPQRKTHGSLSGGVNSATTRWVSGPLPLGGVYQIVAHHKNAFSVSEPITLTEQNPTVELELQFAKPRDLECTVLDSAGQPVADAKIELSFSVPNHGFGLPRQITDRAGKFRLAGVTPGRGEYKVLIEAPRSRAEWVKLDLNQTEQIIRLAPGRTLAGRVVEAETGYVIPNAEVRVWDSQTLKLPGQSTRTDADGHFEFTTLGDVTYSFVLGDAQLLENKSHRADGGTNLLLKAKLYEWSKLQPKRPRLSESPVIQFKVIAGDLRTNGTALVITNNARIKFDEQAKETEVAADVITIENGIMTAQGNVSITKANFVTTGQDWTINLQPRRVVLANSENLPAGGNNLARGNAPLETTNEFLSVRELQINRNSNSVTGMESVLPLPIIKVSSAAQLSNALSNAPFSRLKDKAPFLGDLPGATEFFTNPFINTSPDQPDEWVWVRGELGFEKGRAPTTKGIAAEPLAERAFNVDLRRFYAAVGESAGLTEPINNTNIMHAVRPYFANLGVNLDPALRKSIFLSTSRGDVWVRATESELDILEQLFRSMPGIPLIRRTYPINPVAIAKIAASLPPELGAMVATNPAAGFRKLIESFDATDPRPKGVHYLPDRGELIARATEADHNQFSILLQQPPKPSPTLGTREYKLPVELVQERILSNAYPAQVYVKVGSQNDWTNRMELSFQALRDWFSNAGVELDPRQGKSIFYNDRAGIVYARATPEELDKIEAAIRDLTTPTLTTQTFQVNPIAITQSVKDLMSEFPDLAAATNNPSAEMRTLLEILGVSLYPPKSLDYNPQGGALTVRATPSDLKTIEELLRVIGVQQPQVHIKTLFVEADDDLTTLLRDSVAGTNQNPNTAISLAATPSILSPAQLESILKTLKEKHNAEIISAPQITTLSGRQVQIQMVNMRTISTEMIGVVSTNLMVAAPGADIPIGQYIDVMPLVSTDQSTIQLTLAPSITEFIGSDQATAATFVPTPPSTNNLPLPIFRVRQITTSVVVQDGQTVMLSGFSDRLSRVNTGNNSIEKSLRSGRQMLFFVTPLIIDQAGNPANPPQPVPPKLIIAK